MSGPGDRVDKTSFKVGSTLGTEHETWSRRLLVRHVNDFISVVTRGDCNGAENTPSTPQVGGSTRRTLRSQDGQRRCVMSKL